MATEYTPYDAIKLLRNQCICYAIVQTFLVAGAASLGLWPVAFIMGLATAFTVYSVKVANRLVKWSEPQE